MPRRWQGERNRLRARRERPYQSRQRTVSRASFDTQIVPDTASLVLTTFAPTVSTPVVVTPANASLVLTGFASSVATPRKVTPGVANLVLTGFAPSVATPRVVTPGVARLTLATFAPTITTTANVLITPATAVLALVGYAPQVMGDPVISTDASGGGTVIRTLRETELDTRPLPFKVPEHELPEAPEPLVAQIVTLKRNDTDAYIALFAAGEISEDEFVALLAA